MVTIFSRAARGRLPPMGYLLYTSSDTSENLIASWVSAAWMILQMSRHGVVAGTYQGGNMAWAGPVLALDNDWSSYRISSIARQVSA